MSARRRRRTGASPGDARATSVRSWRSSAPPRSAHEQHWLRLLDGEPRSHAEGEHAHRARRRGSPRTSESIFTLALAQLAEARSPYDTDPYASPAHARRREGAPRGRPRPRGAQPPSGCRARSAQPCSARTTVSCRTWRWCMGIGATGVSGTFVLFSGIAGLLAGALSMGAGEFVSVKSQRELLESTEPSDYAHAGLPDLDLDANELALVYRTRGDDGGRGRGEGARDRRCRAGGQHARAAHRAGVVRGRRIRVARRAVELPAVLGGAIIPVLPWIFGPVGRRRRRGRARARGNRAACRPARWSACCRARRRCPARCGSSRSASVRPP